MECRKQLCEKCKKKEDDYFLVTPLLRLAPSGSISELFPFYLVVSIITDFFSLQ